MHMHAPNSGATRQSRDQLAGMTAVGIEGVLHGMELAPVPETEL